MGGGGMIRAVGKISGITGSRGLRGASTVPAAEHAARGVRRKTESLSTSQSGKISGGISQGPASELDEWELAGGEDDLVMSEPLPRVVFGAVPSFQEAKEATDELKDALEKVYLSSPAAAESGDSLSASQVSDHNTLSIVDADQSAISPAAPKHAVQAFKLLTQNAAAQNVVASIASDPNVWNAVLHNEVLMGFLQSQRAAAVEFPSDEFTVKTVDDVMSQNFESANDTTSGNAENGFMNGFMKSLKDVKDAVEAMISNLSCFLHNIFSSNPDEKSAADEEGGHGGSSNLSASFFGLAVLAIIVVLLKRP